MLVIVGFMNDDLLDLVELVHAIQPGRVFAGGAGFAAEAGADSGHLFGQVGFFQNLAAVETG